MDIAALHEAIDKWAADQTKDQEDSSTPVEAEVVEAPKRELPEGQRVVRTKQSGDRVYLLDDKASTRAWVTSPEVLESYGFELGDVIDVDESELLKYNMSPALYKPKE